MSRESRAPLLDLLTRMQASATPLDEGNGCFQAVIPADLWREFVDAHAAALYASAHPSGNGLKQDVENVLKWEAHRMGAISASTLRGVATALSESAAIGLLRMWEDAAHTDNYSPGHVIEEQTRRLLGERDGS